MKKSPLQQVRDEFGTKEALAGKLLPLLDRREGESDAEFEQRIKTASNKQLLRLWAVAGTVKDQFGTKDALLDAIVTLKFGKENADYRARIAPYTSARLLDLHATLQNRASA